MYWSDALLHFQVPGICAIQEQYREQNAFILGTIYALFGIVVTVHMGRLYFTLEMLDSDHKFFVNYVQPLSGMGRIIEWIIRVLVLFVVTLKPIGLADEYLPPTFQPHTGNGQGLAALLLMLYLSLLLWDFFIGFTRVTSLFLSLEAAGPVRQAISRWWKSPLREKENAVGKAFRKFYQASPYTLTSMGGAIAAGLMYYLLKDADNHNNVLLAIPLVLLLAGAAISWRLRQLARFQG